MCVWRERGEKRREGHKGGKKDKKEGGRIGRRK